MTPAEERSYIQLFDRTLLIWERLALRLTLPMLRGWLRSVTGSLRANGITQTTANIGTLIQPGAVQGLLTNLYTRVADRAVSLQRGVLERFTGKPPDSFVAGFGSATIRQRLTGILNDAETGNRITGITESMRRDVKRVLADAATRNLDIRATSKLIADELGGKHLLARATRIARTETTRAASIGAELGTVGSRLQLVKKWIATSDGRTRPSHAAMIGRDPVAKDGFFVVGGKRMRYPGDPAGGVSEVANCRCAIVYVPDTRKQPTGQAMPARGRAGKVALRPAPVWNDGGPVSQSKTIAEAEMWAIRYGIATDVSYGKVTPAIADRINNQLYRLIKEYKKPLSSIYTAPGKTDFFFKTGPSFDVQGVNLVISEGFFSSAAKSLDSLREMARSELSGFLWDGRLEGSVIHEYGHVLYAWQYVGLEQDAQRLITEWSQSLSREPSPTEQQAMQTDYGRTNLHEAQAEAFTYYHTKNPVSSLSPLEKSLLRKIVNFDEAQR